MFSNANETTHYWSSVPKKERTGVTLVHAQSSLRKKISPDSQFPMDLIRESDDKMQFNG
jgi:hypothetical protein